MTLYFPFSSDRFVRTGARFTRNRDALLRAASGRPAVCVWEKNEAPTAKIVNAVVGLGLTGVKSPFSSSSYLSTDCLCNNMSDSEEQVDQCNVTQGVAEQGHLIDCDVGPLTTSRMSSAAAVAHNADPAQNVGDGRSPSSTPLQTTGFNNPSADEKAAAAPGDTQDQGQMMNGQQVCENPWQYVEYDADCSVLFVYFWFLLLFFCIRVTLYFPFSSDRFVRFSCVFLCFSFVVFPFLHSSDVVLSILKR